MHDVFESLIAMSRLGREDCVERYVRLQWDIGKYWDSIIGPLSGSTYDVVYDAPQPPHAATRAAARALSAVVRDNSFQEWFKRHIHNVFVHSASGVDVVAIRDNSIHFFEAKQTDDPWEASLRLYDRLTDQQRDDYSSLRSRGTSARENFAALFAWIICLADWEESTPGEVERRFRAGLIPRDVVTDISSFPAPCGTDRPGCGNDANPAWSEERNARRCDLIDKEIEGTLSEEERIELNQLQRHALEYRNRVAPLPTKGARKLHAQLLEKKRRKNQEK